MVQSKAVMERNIHVYDEDDKWQLPEPGALMSAKAYHDKKALPLVDKLKELVKNLTIKCVRLTEQVKELTAKVGKQQEQISRLTDLGRLKRYFGREQVQSALEQSKALEQAERANRRLKRSIGMSR